MLNMARTPPNARCPGFVMSLGRREAPLLGEEPQALSWRSIFTALHNATIRGVRSRTRTTPVQLSGCGGRGRQPPQCHSRLVISLACADVLSEWLTRFCRCQRGRRSLWACHDEWAANSEAEDRIRFPNAGTSLPTRGYARRLGPRAGYSVCASARLQQPQQ
ncbi:hypothetical protein K466DRAFT_63340 [Polyporus arcularius HHB13444]|uniref:Uncharacterized protein n=1 Tax=Polyporus arcularius HHB13444 TaxID=1314778 RepID=A0A5C3PHA3_9APHY|nr:hypothetical protein K466DRAFT_63340 [Polyporus arcularius HHB13444]